MIAQRPEVPRLRPFAVAVRSDPRTDGPGPPGSTAELSGELDASGVAGLWNVLQDLHRAGHPRVVLDLSGLNFLDAAGLGLLVRADRLFAATDRTLALTGLRPPQRRLLELTGLDCTLTLH